MNGIDYRSYAYDGDDCPRVTLTEWEHLRAQDVARRLRQESLSDGKKEFHYDPDTLVDSYEGEYDKGLHMHRIGALAEQSGAKALNVYWPAHVNVAKSVSDLPGNIEVRLIGIEFYGLRVRNDDADDRRVVGVVMPKGTEFGPIRILGWVYAGEAKRACWKMNPYDGRWMYAVPQMATRPLWELQKILMGDGELASLPRVPHNGRRPIDEVAEEIEMANAERKRIAECRHDELYDDGCCVECGREMVMA